MQVNNMHCWLQSTPQCVALYSKDKSYATYMGNLWIKTQYLSELLFNTVPQIYTKITILSPVTTIYIAHIVTWYQTVILISESPVLAIPKNLITVYYFTNLFVTNYEYYF